MDQDCKCRELEKNQIADNQHSDSGVVRYSYACTLANLIKELPRGKQVPRRDNVLYFSRPLAPDCRKRLVFGVQRYDVQLFLFGGAKCLWCQA